MTEAIQQNLRAAVQHELVVDILPFWMRLTVDEARGGFYGVVSNDLHVERDAPRAVVICARMLWTYSAAFLALGRPEYLQMAHHAYEYLTGPFLDAAHGGFYWMLNADGSVQNPRKQLYAQAFALYGLTEYFRASGNLHALELARAGYALIESKSRDALSGGYFEAYAQDWGALDDWRLSARDLNSPKSMNTLLHILEAYSNLLRVWDDADLRRSQRALIEIFLQHVIDPQTHHFRLFFDADWRSLDEHISFGHDIEGSWLLMEAADLLGDAELSARVRQAGLGLAAATLAEGLDADGGVMYEAAPHGIEAPQKHWWPQAEGVVGFLNAYQVSGEARYLQAAWSVWEFIQRCVIDRRYGEWFALLERDGFPLDERTNPGQHKVGPWKCPYHNARMCLEVMRRVS